LQKGQILPQANTAFANLDWGNLLEVTHKGQI